MDTIAVTTIAIMDHMENIRIPREVKLSVLLSFLTLTSLLRLTDANIATDILLTIQIQLAA